MPAGQPICWLNETRDLSRNADAYSPPAHFGKANSVAAAVGFVGSTLFSSPDVVDGLSQVPIPFHGVHRQVKVSVESEHKEAADIGVSG